MSVRVTRSQTGRTPSKPSRPGYVETPGRRRSTRNSILSDREDSATPEPSVKLEEKDRLVPNGLDLKSNGYANGLTNGHSNGVANGDSLYSPLNGSANGSGVDLSNGIAKKKGKTAEEDALNFGPVDPNPKREFGGSFGMLAMMVGFPALMYYMWIGQSFYDGRFPRPAENQSMGDFFWHMVSFVKNEAYPSNKAWSIYWYFGLLQMAFYMLLPGVYRKGKSLPHLGGKQLDYYCSAMWSYYTTIAIALTLHFTGYFKIYTIIDEFGPIMSVAIISGFLCSFIAFFSAKVRGATMRMTGWPIVDFFLGAELNPRLFGILDFKMFLEVRIPWFIMTFLAMGATLRQWDVYGKISDEAWFIMFAQWAYANACAKGEHMIITTWDMYYEKLGFMLIFWNMAGVPFSYCQPMLFIANQDPNDKTWPRWFVIAMVAAYCAVYYVWDTCNSQKNAFRQEERGVLAERKTFPYFAYGRLKNPKTIQTKQGSKLLVDGWYGKARKVHYTCDLFFAITWGLITGFKSPFPWFYSVFFFFMILHRASRDIERCHDTYGEAWEEYTRQVPYLFIPYVF